MKKGMSLVLALVMCLSLCACGKNNTCTCDCKQCALCEQKTNAQGVVETGDDANKIVFPAPVCLVENEEVRVELLGFHQKDAIVKEVTTTKKYIALKIHNKTSYEIRLKLENLAVNDEEVMCVYQQSTTQFPRILPGDTTTYYIEIRPAFEDALNAMEDLYTLKGRVQVGQYTKYQGYDGFRNPSDLSFSVADAMDRY